MSNTLVWTFAERCAGARAVEDVRRLFLREVDALGFPYVACASHVDPLRPPPEAVTMLKYPQPWVEHFSIENLAKRDPVFLTAQRQLLPFRWRDRGFRKTLTADQLAILDLAAEAGLADGFTIPLHSPGALPASCSLVFGPDGVDPLNIQNAHWCAVYAHEAARRILREQPFGDRNRLSAREREALEYVARGKGDYAIGVLMGIQESSAHNTVQRAMRKLGVATRVQAVVRAMAEGEILLHDVAH